MNNQPDISETAIFNPKGEVVASNPTEIDSAFPDNFHDIQDQNGSFPINWDFSNADQIVDEGYLPGFNTYSDNVFNNNKGNGKEFDPTTGQILAKYIKEYAKAAKKIYCIRKSMKSPSEYIFSRLLFANPGLPDAADTLALVGFGANEENLKEFMTLENSGRIDFPGVNGAKVHQVLYEHYIEWETYGLPDLLNQIDNHPSWNTVQFYGYGFGGVAAEFAAISLHKRLKRPLIIAVFSFGKPRIGNAAFAKHLSSIATVTRFTNQNDPIPRLPIGPGYDPYLHAGTEIWNSGQNGKFLICQPVKDPLKADVESENQECINKNPIKILEHHFGPYFGISMASCEKDFNDRPSITLRLDSIFYESVRDVSHVYLLAKNDLLHMYLGPGLVYCLY
ncbi:hypothetical protein G9A89_002347 [Geosiphon pyriformis]|nr:hypothetical protein G9A89_002347 [Geosiphon pyriformis]